MNKLFKDFGRVTNDQDALLNKNGVGLGLNLSNKLASLLAPQASENRGILVESEYKKGSKFSFFIADKFRGDLERKIVTEQNKD